MKLQRLEFPLDIKAADDEGRVDGYGSVFDVVDQGGDIVESGAFTKSLREIKSAGKTVPMLWQHDPGDPVGVWDDVKQDQTGLRVKGQVLTDTTRGRDALAFLKAKAVNGLSIGFKTNVDEVDRKTGVRTIKQAELWEVSLVTFPMNDKARVLSAKAEDVAQMTERDIERTLRDAGLSAREAKTVVSRLMDLGSQRDAADIRDAATVAAKAERLLGLFRANQHP